MLRLKDKDSGILSQFRVKKLLGSGGFGAVFQVENTRNVDNGQFALKIAISGSDEQLQEVKNWEKIPKHENIVKYINSWMTTFTELEINALIKQAPNLNIDLHHLRSFAGIVIQMEMCNQDLRNWLSKNQHQTMNEFVYWKQVIGFFEQISAGLQHIHSSEIIHRDLKPTNIFLSQYIDSYIIKIGDFGLSTVHLNKSADGSHTGGIGTRAYAAPEQIASTKYSKRVDLFSLGLVLFELFWKMEQDNTNRRGRIEYFNELRHAQTVPSGLESSWPKIAQLIKNLTKEDPKERPTFEVINNVIEEFKSKLESSYNMFYNSSNGCTIPLFMFDYQ